VDDFEAHRGHLRAVAHRMLGSTTEADDAVQEAWLRLNRVDRDRIDNTRAWLTTVVARVCLDMLRARTTRQEVVLDAPLPAAGPDPEEETVLADSVGLALLVVLDALTPAERLAFVLHDMFAVPFDEIGPILGRSTPAAKMLASRARRRVRDAGTPTDLARRHAVVAAFLAASREGDFAALVELLDPEVTARADAVAAGTPTVLHGAAEVARRALLFARRAEHARVDLVDGTPAVLVTVHGRLVLALTFAFADRITEIDIIADPDHLARLVAHSPGG
jgi:RNA polymerase sigma factor (sigma-70 family)